MAAICGASKKGDTVIVARNVHCSVNNALFLNELNPVYIYPEIDEIGICTGITRESVRAALEEHVPARRSGSKSHARRSSRASGRNVTARKMM